MVLNRNRLIDNSSEKNPLVKDLASSLQSMQRTIIQSVDNLIVSLNTQIRSIPSAGSNYYQSVGFQSESGEISAQCGTSAKGKRGALSLPASKT